MKYIFFLLLAGCTKQQVSKIDVVVINDTAFLDNTFFSEGGKSVIYDSFVLINGLRYKHVKAIEPTLDHWLRGFPGLVIKIEINS